MMFTCFITLALLGGCFGMPTNTTQRRGNLTADAIEIDCTLYRPDSEDIHKYEVFTQGEWENRNCSQALVWDQDMCRCENPSSDDLDCGKVGVAGSAAQYQNVVWGVLQSDLQDCPKDQIWNQTACRCDWDPEGPGAVEEGPDFVYNPAVRSCEIMFNATFDTDIREQNNGYTIGQAPWGSIKIENTPGAIGGGAAVLDNGHMIIWSIAGNDFSNAFQIQLRFEVTTAVDDYVPLLSNECDYGEPSFFVKYNAMTNIYQVFYRDFNSSNTLECAAKSDPQGYVSISLELQDGTLAFVVDGQAACDPIPFNGQPPISGCPLRLGGDYLNNNFQGFIDEFVIRRNCVVSAQADEQ